MSEALEFSEEGGDDSAEKPDETPKSTAEEAPPVEIQLAVREYQRKLNNILRHCEKLKLDWVDYQFDKAYYRSWNWEANRAFRKKILLDWRLNRLIERQKKSQKE